MAVLNLSPPFVITEVFFSPGASACGAKICFFYIFLPDVLINRNMRFASLFALQTYYD